MRDSIQTDLMSRGYTCVSDMMPTGLGVRYTVEVQSVDCPCEITVEGSALIFYFTAPQKISPDSRVIFCMGAMMKLGDAVSGIKSEMMHYEALSVDYDVFLSVSHEDLDQNVGEFALKCMQAFYDLDDSVSGTVTGLEGLAEFQRVFCDGPKEGESFPAITYRVSEGSCVEFHVSVAAKEGGDGSADKDSRVICVEWNYPSGARLVDVHVASCVTSAISHITKGDDIIFIPTEENKIDDFDFRATLSEAREIHPLCMRINGILSSDNLTITDGVLHATS